MDQMSLYDLMDPHDFRVGHRYRFSPNGHEADLIVSRVELVGDTIVVTTTGGDIRTYPANQITVINCDVVEQ